MRSRSLVLCLKRGRDSGNIAYRGIYKTNLTNTEIMPQGKLPSGEAESLIAILTINKDLFTANMYKTVCCTRDV